MGYGFIGYHRATDDGSLFYTECIYAYEPVFKQCFGKEISKFSGRVTKKKIDEFKIGLEKFTDNYVATADINEAEGVLVRMDYRAELPLSVRLPYRPTVCGTSVL